MSTFTDVMVDLETTGTDPEHCAILQIAAVKFNPKTREVSTDTFDRSLNFAPNRFWEEGGRAFWQKMPDVYKGIVERAEDPALVLRQFSQWVNKDYNPDGPIRLWAKPIHFEWGFISSYYKQYGMPMPFHYRTARDLNSVICGLRTDFEHNSLDKEVPFEGAEHNALWDVFHQIKILFYALDKYGIIER